MRGLRSYGALGLAAAVVMGFIWLTESSPAAAGGDIRGVVRGESGPEAGVWVIATTDDLETVYRKIVVTDDDGQFLVPDLPEATYEVWVRGYGLVDSDKKSARPGDDVTFTATAAATPQEAAQLYRPTIGTRCWKSQPRANSPVPGPTETA